MSVSLTQEFSLVECCACGVAFAIPARLERMLRETHRSFHCPSGHAQAFLQETAAERAAKERDAANAEAARLRAELERVAKRVGNGVCPCCNRSFADLARHMRTKHKGRALPDAGPKRLTP